MPTMSASTLLAHHLLLLAAMAGLVAGQYPFSNGGGFGGFGGFGGNNGGMMSSSMFNPSQPWDSLPGGYYNNRNNPWAPPGAANARPPLPSWNPFQPYMIPSAPRPTQGGSSLQAVARPASPARLCRQNGTCRVVDHGTTVAPTQPPPSTPRPTPRPAPTTPQPQSTPAALTAAPATQSNTTDRPAATTTLQPAPPTLNPTTTQRPVASSNSRRSLPRARVPHHRPRSG